MCISCLKCWKVGNLKKKNDSRLIFIICGRKKYIIEREKEKRITMTRWMKI
jgi:hypothetical protein